MSRYISSEAESLDEIAVHLGRIADTLDDYMTMTLGAQRIVKGLTAADPDAALAAFEELLAVIEKDRAARDYWG